MFPNLLSIPFRLIFFPNLRVCAFMAVILLGLSASQVFAQTDLDSHSQNGTSMKVGYDEGNSRLYVTFNTGTYQCGLSIWRRPWKLYIDGSLRDSAPDILNGGNSSFTYYVSNPEPGREYDFRLEVKNSGKGTCADINSVVFDKTITVSVTGMSGLNTTYNTANNSITATWNKGLIKAEKYTVKLSGKSIANPGDGFQEISSNTGVSGTATSYTFTGLYPGITYKTEVVQSIPGSHSVALSDELTQNLTTASRLSGASATSGSSAISVGWTNPSISLPLASYIRIEREKINIGTSTVSEANKTLADIGKSITNPSTYTDNSEENCQTHVYTINLVYKNGNFEQIVHSIGGASADFPRSPETPGLPGNFTVRSLNTAEVCTTDIALLWNEDPNRHPCQEYWFDIDRYQLNAEGSRIGSKVDVVVESTDLGSSDIYDYTFTDTGAKVDGATYEYEIRTITKWPDNSTHGSSVSLRSVSVGGTIADYTGTITATIDPLSSLTITWDDIPNENGYLIKRKIGAKVDKEFPVTAQNVVSLTDGVSSGAASCVDYTYEVFAVNACEPNGVSLGSVSTGIDPGGDEASLTFAADFTNTYHPRTLQAYKGYEKDFIFLEWDIAQNAANIKQQKLYRRPVSNLGDSVLIASLDRSARSYTDNEANANVLYNYYLTAEVECGASGTVTNTVSSVGFRTPWGLVNGHVDFVGGVDVEGAQIAAENPAALSLNKSLYFDGDRDYAIIIDKDNTLDSLTTVYADVSQTALPFLFGDKARTIEFWAKPESYNGGSLFYIGHGTAQAGSLPYLGLEVPNSGSSKVWALNLGSETLALDLTGVVSEGSWNHFAVTFDGSTIRVYVDGSNVSGTGEAMAWNRALNTSIDSIARYIVLGGGFDLAEDVATTPISYRGHLEEFRVWDRALTQAEIVKNKSGFLFGNEQGLQIYLRMDENFGDYLYDASYDGGNNFHRRHFSLFRDSEGNEASFSAAVPSSDQLGYNAITDARGNYTIPYIRYRGTGELFNLVPFIFGHEFRPSNRNLFIGQSTPVHNEQDFEDISAFKVTGTVMYGREEVVDGETTVVTYCPAVGLYLAVDGTISLRDGAPVQTDENGEFELSVPIGEHFISVSSSGHTFLTGRYPAVGTHDFQSEVAGLEFIDNTQMKVIGMVVGGTVEEAKASGFGRTKNNIGVADIVFDAGCFSTEVKTDMTTGEYEAYLFPLEYTVHGGANPALDKEQFVRSNPEVKFPIQIQDLRFIRPLVTEQDTVLNTSGEIVKIDEISFNLRHDYVHRESHSLTVLNPETMQEFQQGEDYITVLADGAMDTIMTDQFDHPVFQQFGTYQALIKLTEIYTNADNPDQVVYDTVGVTDGKITIANGLADENVSFDLNNADGDSLYVFRAGLPNLLLNESNPESSYLKELEIVSEIGTASNTWSLSGYVLGNKPNGTSFITKGPDVVQHMLFDPPGSQSSATITKESQFISNLSWDLAGIVGKQNQLIIEAGAAFSTGVGVAVDTEVKGNSGLTFQTRVELGGGADYSEIVTITEDISTGSDPLFVGPDADLFIGKAYNVNFGVSDFLKPLPQEDCLGDIPCKTSGTMPAVSTSGKEYYLGSRSNFTIAPEDYGTYFIYTRRHIQTQLIPDLIRLRNQMLAESPHYTSKLSPDHPNYGLNNDDPKFGGQVSTETPKSRENADFDGPSYTFSKTFAENEEVVDSVRKYNQQIELWVDALRLSEELKVNANLAQSVPDAGNIGDAIGKGINKSLALLEQETGTLEENISFSSGTSYSRGVNLQNDISWRFSWEVEFSVEHAVQLGASVSNTGVEVTNSTTIGLRQSGETSRSESHSIGYQFTLQDDDLGNFYSVDILDGGNQNGPIFKIQGGASSCPYEGQVVTEFYEPGTVVVPATLQHERPVISITPSRQVGIPADEPAVYTLTLGNENTTFSDGVDYTLYVEPASNPNGAIMTIDGQDVNRNYWLGPGQVINRQLVVHKSPQQNDFQDIVLVFASTCDPNIRQEVTLSATFIPTCSNSSIVTPLNQWVANNSFENSLPVTIGGYDINFGGLEKIIFRYKPSTSSQWIERATFLNKEEAESGELLIARSNPRTIYNWDISSLTDGNYDLQTLAVCADGTTRESEVVSGKIDRVDPHVFGKPTPADGVLSPDDEISIRFNETIDAERIIKNLNFDVRGVLNGIPVRHFTGIGFDGDDNVTIPNLTLAGAFTFEVWFNRGRTGVDETLIAYGNLKVGINAANQIYVTNGTTTVTGQTAVASGTWSHLSIAYDRNAGQINGYLNGNTDIAATFSTSPANTDVVVGSNYQGSLHELRIWSDTRQLTEVRLDYLNTLSGNEINLAGYWPMDEGTGTVAFDKTGRRSAIVNANWYFAQEVRGIALDGAGDHFEIDGSTVAFGPEEDFTLSFWFKSDKAADVALFSNGKVDGAAFDYQAWALMTDGTGQLALHSNGALYPIQGDYLDGNFHHMALSVNRIGSVNLYMDGELVISTSAQFFSSFAGNKIYLGAYGRFEGTNEMLSHHMPGVVDEVRVWNSARQKDQIERDMRFRQNGDEFGLFAYFPFERYVEDGFGQLVLTPTIADQSDKSVSGLDEVVASLVGDADYTAATTAIKMARPVESVTFNYAINNDQIIITPTEANGRIENVTLDVTVGGLFDLNGNRMASPVTWIAFMDKNQVKWMEHSHEAVISSDVPYQFTTTIINSGGEAMDFLIKDIPSWLHVNPSSGKIDPLSNQVLTFTADAGPPLGNYLENILLSTAFGYDEVFQLSLKVSAPAPDWQVNGDDFEYSMNVVGQVSVDGILSDDTNDMVAAVINGEIRGVATVSDQSNGRFVVFLTIYSNSQETEGISYRIWDADQGIVKAATVTSGATFVNEALHGSIGDPVTISTGNEVVVSYRMNAGWNWLSFPFEFDEAAPGVVLADVAATTNDVLKGQTSFAQYEEDLGWGGSLTAVDGLAGYKMFLASPLHFEISGIPIDLSQPISLTEGWNWISYLPVTSQTLTRALSGYAASDGDIIKSKNAFAVFDGLTNKWLGTLNILEHGEGYLLRAGKSGELFYPAGIAGGRIVKNEVFEVPSADNYPSNMSLVVTSSMANLGYDLLAFHQGELRGRAKAIDGKYYLTVHGDADTEILDLTFEKDQWAVSVEKKIDYVVDGVLYVELDPETTPGNLALGEKMAVYPIPFEDVININYQSSRKGFLNISIFSLSGAKLATVFEGEVDEGIHAFQYQSSLQPGIYMMLSDFEGEIETKKIIK